MKVTSKANGNSTNGKVDNIPARKKSISPSALLALEPRILFDGAAVATGAEVINEFSNAGDANSVNVALHENSNNTELFAALSQPSETNNVRTEIAFVDTSVENYEILLNEFDENVEIVLIDNTGDGVEQIASVLSDRQGIDAVHIVSHGNSGTLELGSTKLTAASINGRHADEMAIIADAMSEDGDILIYGCNFGQYARGQNAVEAFATATGADVAASDDLTGAAALGGDWDLEVSQGVVETAEIEALAFTGLLVDPIAQDDGPIAITGGVATNIDVRVDNGNGADTDPDGDPLTVTTIIDPSDPSNPQAISVGNPVTLTTGTTIDILIDGTLDVTASTLGQGIETFDYVIDDGNSGADQATVTLDRSQGSLINVPAVVNGVEDNNSPLNVTIDPALTSGGSQLDLISTETGFRDATGGATPSDFTIPPRTTAIRITAYGGEDNGGSNGNQEHRQTFTVTVDLTNNTYSGHILHVIANASGDNDNYAFSGVTLGADSDSGSVVGATNQNVLTVSRSGDTLSLVESQTLMDQAYLVEYLTADGTSSDYLGSSGAILDRGITPAETTATVATDATANFLVVTLQDGRGTNDNKQEDNGGGRIIIDLDTGLASGVLYGQTGRGDTNNAAYSFTDYDITSGAFILDTANSGATIVGDTTALVNRIPNYIISMSGSNLVLERTTDYANLFEELISVQSYERFDSGSSAQSLGSDAVVGDFIHDQTLATWDLDIAGGAETGDITLTATGNGLTSSPTSAHDHGATARIFVDLVNNTTSGSFFLIRADNPDLIVWTDVPFGTRLVDAIGTNANANFANLNQTTIDLVGALQFDLITNPDGSQTLQATAQSNDTVNNNWSVAMQAQWVGRDPVTISGYPTGGSFTVGALNPNAGNWEVDASEIAGIEFIPPEHFSGTTTTMLVDYNGDQHNVTINLARVADAPTVVTADQTGNEDTTIDISGAVAASLVDADGSETITLQQLDNITVGHTVSDGTNSFTATLGTQAVDITSWSLGSLDLSDVSACGSD